MLSLLSPLWLAGLAALAVPLVLHLWNRRPTTVVRIGSLRGLGGPPGPQSLGPRLDDLPLLLLRMAVLAAVAVGLAGLAIQRTAAAEEAVSVLLVDPTVLADSLAVYSDPAVDSLRRAGVPLRLLTPGFPLPDGDAAPAGHDETDWALLRQLDDTLPAGSRVTVVSAMTAGRLGAMRPSLRSHYEFRRAGSRDSAGVAVRSVGEAETDTMTVGIVVGEGFEGESDWVSAAWVAAIEAQTGTTPQLTRVESDSIASGGGGDAELLIWLADQPVAVPIIDRVVSGATLVEFVDGPVEELTHGEIHIAATSGAAAALFGERVARRSAVPAGAAVLVDGNGDPLVTVERLGAGRRYRVATRIGGDWSTMNLGRDLPELALLTLRGHRTGVAVAPVHPNQASPRVRATVPTDAVGWQALTPWLILLAGLLFVVERLFQHRQRRMATA